MSAAASSVALVSTSSVPESVASKPSVTLCATAPVDATVQVPVLLTRASALASGTPADQLPASNQLPVAPVQTVCAPAAAGSARASAANRAALRTLRMLIG